jgi:hypothetical protein
MKELDNFLFSIGTQLERMLPPPKPNNCFKCKRRIERYETHILQVTKRTRKRMCWQCYEVSDEVER